MSKTGPKEKFYLFTHEISLQNGHSPASSFQTKGLLGILSVFKSYSICSTEKTNFLIMLLEKVILGGSDESFAIKSTLPSFILISGLTFVSWLI